LHHETEIGPRLKLILKRAEKITAEVQVQQNK